MFDASVHLAKPGKPRRVVVTGAGVVTPLGIGWAENAAGFREGRRAIRPVTLFDVSRQRAREAGEVTLPSTPPETPCPIAAKRRLNRGSCLLLHAATEAWHQSGWAPGPDIPLILGTTSCGMDSGETYFQHATRHPGRRRGQPTRALGYQAQRQALDALEGLGLSDSITLIANACASGSMAIGQAWETIRGGRADRVLTGGYDALSQMVYAGFDSLQALSTTTCRPFDADRDGLTLGEGAAVLALESLDHARDRGATILGEIIGYGSTADIHHLTQPQPQGDAALRTMEEACRWAGIAPADVDYINAHGTGTPLNDLAEARAINRWAGPRRTTLPVSSTKASIGHLLGAAGAVEAVVGLMALQGQWLPPETGIGTVDPTCEFLLVRQPATADLKVILSNSFGFGGATATLALRRWEP